MPSPSTASQSRINAERLAHLLPKGNPSDSVRPEHALSRKYYITAILIPKSWRSPLGHGRSCPGHLGNLPRLPSREIVWTSPAMTSRTYRKTGTDMSTLFPGLGCPGYFDYLPSYVFRS